MSEEGSRTRIRHHSYRARGDDDDARLRLYELFTQQVNEIMLGCHEKRLLVICECSL